ncbi:MAG: DUF1127 domain-containing protein [Pseudomonadota bacterium]
MTGMFDKLRSAARKRRAYRGIVSELSALSDRELSDIGIHRSDADRIAHEAIYGK